MISISKINSKIFSKSHVISERTFGVVEKFSKMQSPAQRAAIGATALILQPVIDAMNKGVDKKTKETSIARSISKAVICTSTGMLMRGAFIKLAKKLSKEGGPLFIKQLKNTGVTDTQAGNYINAVGTAAALICMIVTNFVIDAPLTNLAQNAMTKHIFHHKQEDKTEMSK